VRLTDIEYATSAEVNISAQQKIATWRRRENIYFCLDCMAPPNEQFVPEIDIIVGHHNHASTLYMMISNTAAMFSKFIVTSVAHVNTKWRTCHVDVTPALRLCYCIYNV
jgi:hypothetical protein